MKFTETIDAYIPNRKNRLTQRTDDGIKIKSETKSKKTAPTKKLNPGSKWGKVKNITRKISLKN